uniref:Uncharacterized protein n=1 Tax=Arundo donax TaxID=35708 RepID=A0A0A8XUH0_ARUDO
MNTGLSPQKKHTGPHGTQEPGDILSAQPSRVLYKCKLLCCVVVISILLLHLSLCFSSRARSIHFEWQ